MLSRISFFRTPSQRQINVSSSAISYRPGKTRYRFHNQRANFSSLFIAVRIFTLSLSAFSFVQIPRLSISSIYFCNQDITLRLPHEIKQLGVSYIPQDFNIFPQMSVEENLLMGAWIFRNQKQLIQKRLNNIYEIFPALFSFRKVKANTLSGGQQRMLSIAKEVMTFPQLMLVDEPSSGLAPKIATEAYQFLIHTKEALNAAIVLVDHNMEIALNIADYVYVVDMGKIRVHGSRDEFDIDRR
ncbi:MAG: ATP-binding cassette domain-containing protein [Anaerolineales bacterium]